MQRKPLKNSQPHKMAIFSDSWKGHNHNRVSMNFFPVKFITSGKLYSILVINILKDFLTVFSGFDNSYVLTLKNFSYFFQFLIA